MSNAPAIVRGWHLENRTANHNKFYTVLIADNGVVVTAWGRIGAAGQSKIQRLPYADAEAIGLRQVYSKQSGGYAVKVENFKFEIDGSKLLNAAATQQVAPLTKAFHDAVKQPAFEGDRKSVLTHYDEFATKAQNLLDSAGDRPFSEVYAEFDELQAAWKDLDNKHAEVATIVSLVEGTLAQALMSGNLG